MADRVLGRRRELAVADLLPVGQEDRVVAEAATAVRLAEQPTAQYADLEVLVAVGQHERHGAAELRLPLAVRDVTHLGQQQPVVGGVAYSAVGLRQARPARREHARHAVERVEADAGVVGEGWQAGHLDGGPGLDQGVALEGVLRLDRLVVGIDVGEAEHLDIGQLVFEYSPQLLQLPRIVAGQKDLLHVPAPSPNECRWSRVSSTQPADAKPSISSKSARSNGSPSAVPCTSTNRPPPVITTFMSVSALTSSS